MGRDNQSSGKFEWHIGHIGELFRAIEEEGYTPIAEAFTKRFNPELHHDLGKTIVHAVAEQENPQLLRQLLEHYPNINLPSHNKERETALHDAIRAKSLRRVEMLIQHGASLEAQNELGHNALHSVVYWESGVEVITLALSYASPSVLLAESPADGTPVEYAIQNLSRPEAKLFIDRYVELGCPLSLKHSGKYLWRWCKFECWLDLAEELKRAADAEITS